jgi:pimeloyl-ACP methyl ester carboxylesterase
VPAVIRNNVHTVGAGETAMMFAHGFGCDQNMWRHVSPAFEDKFRIVLFDHVGAGGSDLEAYNPVKYSTLMLDAARNEGLSELQIFRRIGTTGASGDCRDRGADLHVRVERLLLVTGASDDVRPLTAGLQSLRGMWLTSWQLISAGSIVAAIPAVLIFFFMQQHFIAGLTAGAQND